MAAEQHPDLAAVAQCCFAHTPEFASSPLYQSLSRTVAGTAALLRLAARGRPGQYPTFLFFGAVHALLLAGADHELATYYPSIVGADARPPEQAGPALVDFCAAFEPQLVALIETRLVQTNVVRRAMALRLGLAAIGRRCGAPVHLIEVGASAGALLRFDRYGYTLGGHRFGDAGSPVQIEAEWRGGAPVPDLDALPPLTGVTGVDLNPLDARDPDDRCWLEALVWPDNRAEADHLRHALAIVAADPPPIRAGDAVDARPSLAEQLPPGEPRVLFHAITRLHVPPIGSTLSTGRSPRSGVTRRSTGCRSKARASSTSATRPARSPTWPASARASNGWHRSTCDSVRSCRRIRPTHRPFGASGGDDLSPRVGRSAETRSGHRRA